MSSGVLMLRRCAGLCVAALLSAPAIAEEPKTCEQEKAALEARVKALEAQLAGQKTPPTASSEGFQGATWGMHRKDVQKLFPKAQPDATSKNMLLSKQSVAGRP